MNIDDLKTQNINMPDIDPDILAAYPELEETWQDKLMHGCLMLGAVFMLICLLAVVFLPPLTADEIDRDLLLPDGASDKSNGAKARHETGGNNADQKNAGNKKGVKAKWEKKKKR